MSEHNDDASTTGAAADEQALEVVQPDEGLAADDDVNKSPVEKAKTALADKVSRDFTAASDDHPLVITAGSKQALQSSANAELIRELSDGIYADEDAFFREWAQNHIAAVVREGKRIVKNEHGRDALYHDIIHEHPENDGERVVRLPKSSQEILEMARDLGYIPNIEFEVDHDDGRIRTRDNGIGMTTGEVIEVWNEPAESGSRTDLASAGTKGLGALTWISVSGEEGGAVVKTRTRREETLNGDPVPERDQQGFSFWSYLGGVLPVDGDLPDGFYGTEFSIPIDPSLDSAAFKSKMEQYTGVLPVQISWTEIRDGERDEEEFEATSFTGRYEEEPNIVIDRPGEFRVALGRPGVVSNGRGWNATYLLDNPIDRNTPKYEYDVDALWNDHIQVLNEQGLIVAGPNRGRLHDEVDELAGNAEDILDDSKPMPDIPLPEPTTSRDQFQQGEALKRFIMYVDKLAEDRELSLVDDYVNGYLNCTSESEALEYIREHGSEYDLFRKLVSHHARHNTPKKAYRLMDWMDSRDSIAFDISNAPLDDDGSQRLKAKHPKYPVIDLLASMQDEVDVYVGDKPTVWSPDKKENRRNKTFAELITSGKWPMFVGAKLNDDRVKVLQHEDNYPDAIILKVNSYGRWQDDPWNARLVKDVPMSHGENEKLDEDWTVPDEVHARHSKSSSVGDDSVDVSENALRVRCTENQSVDFRLPLEEYEAAMERALADGFGTSVTMKYDNESVTGHPWTVVFPPGGENISDHYNLSQYANIINTKAEEAERLRKYATVFTVDEFHAFLADTRLQFYVPETGAYGGARVDTLAEWAMEDGHQLALMWEESDDLTNAVVFDNDHDRLPDDDERRRIARNAAFEELESKHGLKNPLDDESDGDEWRVVRWSEGDLTTRKRAYSYFVMNLPSSHSHRDDLDVGNVMWLGSDRSYPKPSRVKRLSSGNLSRIVERAQYPGWDNDSDAWGRLNTSYNGPTDYEKALLRACRELGIDPTEVEPDRLEQLVVMLATTCEEN